MGVKRKRRRSLGDSPGFRCVLSVGTVQGEKARYNVNPGGWTAAHEKALSIAQSSGGWISLVDLACGGPLAEGGKRIALYQCSRDSRTGRASCVIEHVGLVSEADRPSIAGLGRHRRR